MVSKTLSNGDTLPDWEENIVGKAARYEQFLLPQYFQKLQKLSVDWCVKMIIFGMKG